MRALKRDPDIRFAKFATTSLAENHGRWLWVPAFAGTTSGVVVIRYVGFVALDSGNFIVYTGFVEGAYNAGDSNALSTNATFDLATYNRITSWEIVSITITPA